VDAVALHRMAIVVRLDADIEMIATRWTGLPTAKPTITTLIDRIKRQALPDDFAPAFATACSPASLN